MGDGSENIDRGEKIMRILWVSNFILPEIAEKMRIGAVYSVGGWMVGMWNAIRRQPNMELAICFPLYDQDHLVSGEMDGTKYYGFVQRERVCETYEKSVEEQLRKVMEQYKPDIVHIFGTEYMHSLAAVRAFDRPDRTVIGIQGMVSVYAKHFMAGVPLWVQKGRTFRDVIKRDNLIRQRQSFQKRAVFEKEAIRKVHHVIGRTDWDRACTEQINKTAIYHFCNETLRESFYEKKWSLETCRRHTIFVSQGSYPIKGFHYVLEAMPAILDCYPDACVYVAGGDITKKESLSDRLRQSSYGKYICQLITENHLEEHVRFTGFLDEEEMCQQFLQSHVFVSPSSIENSPNSVGEAMLLGMPVVSSDVGGVKNMLLHEKEGFIYQADAPYMLAYYVKRIFAEDDLAMSLGQAAAEHAAKTHDREENGRRLIAIYKEILKNQEM
jgi:glycosyltransferase involved in cell wall biosynthesis